MCVAMADQGSETFCSINVASLKGYPRKRGIKINGYLKPASIEIASAAKKNMLYLLTCTVFNTMKAVFHLSRARPVPNRYVEIKF